MRREVHKFNCLLQRLAVLVENAERNYVAEERKRIKKVNNKCDNYEEHVFHIHS
jgi:hypothetical protein